MSHLAFLMNFIADKHDLVVSKNFRVFINDFEEYKINSDIYTYKFFIVENVKLDTDEKRDVTDLYILSKIIKNLFKKSIHKFRLKKYNKPIDSDLYFNELKIFPKYQKIDLLCGDSIFSFRLSDLINLWLKALKKTDNMFCKPGLLKNPYTNLPFKTHNLYNIYIGIIFSRYVIPNQIKQFISCNCNVNIYLYENYSELKDNAVKTFIKNSHSLEVMEQVNNMMHEYSEEVNYIYFPNNLTYRQRKLVISSLEAILDNYLYATYGCNTIKKKESLNRVKSDLKLFFSENPFSDFTLNAIPPPPTPTSLPPPPPRDGRPSISFSLPSSNSQFVPISLEHLINTLEGEDSDDDSDEDINALYTRNFRINPFIPSLEIPRTPPNTVRRNSRPVADASNNIVQNVRPFSLRLF